MCVYKSPVPKDAVASPDDCPHTQTHTAKLRKAQTANLEEPVRARNSNELSKLPYEEEVRRILRDRHMVSVTSSQQPSMSNCCQKMGRHFRCLALESTGWSSLSRKKYGILLSKSNPTRNLSAGLERYSIRDETTSKDDMLTHQKLKNDTSYKRRAGWHQVWIPNSLLKTLLAKMLASAR